MLGDRWEHVWVDPNIGVRTDGQRESLGRQALDEDRVVDHRDPVVQAFASEDLDGGGRRLRWRVLALMCGEPEPCGAGSPIGLEIGRRIDATFGRIHAEPEYALDSPRPTAPEFDELLDVVERDDRPELAVDVEDQPTDDAGRLLSCPETLVERRDDVGQRLSADEVTCRSEERLAIDEPMFSTVDDALERQTGPCLGCRQDGLHEPEHVQELGQIGVVEDLGRIIHGQIDSRRVSQIDHRAGPHRALDVAVQLDLG